MKYLRKTLKTILILAIIAIAIIGAYVLYVMIQYSRIPDNKELTISNNEIVSTTTLMNNTTYTAATYNIGFGAYSPDFTFFMDSGYMKDGTPVKGKYGTAFSKEDVIKNTDGAINAILDINPTFALLQEVDTNSTRSFKINQADEFTNAFKNMSSNFALNFHSFYSVLPFNNPHGIANAGLLTLSKVKMDSALRKSYPLSDKFPAKYFDLDRSFSITYINVENGKKLALINSHMSAYDKGGIIRAQQLETLNEFMRDEYNKGNYVIVGGDFNHALGNDVINAFETQQETPRWISILNNEDLDPFMRIAKAENQLEVATCRSSDIPYVKGVNYLTVIDGFIVSDNIKTKVTNIDNDFQFSDHQPVLLEFELLN